MSLSPEITALVRQGITDEQLAVWFHITYERLAPEFGYETRPDTKAFDPQSKNGKLMVAVCGQAAAALREQAGEFKNFHRLLCERFNYAHDDIDWKRDQLSLIEWIAEERDTLRAEVAALRKDAERWRHVRTHPILATTFARTDPRDPHCLLASDAYDKRTPEWLEERIDAALADKQELCDDCPPVGYLTDETRCAPCPRRAALSVDKPQQSVTDSIDSPQPPLE